MGIAEKGYVSLELSAKGEGGHSSMPPRRTAVGILIRQVLPMRRCQAPGKSLSWWVEWAHP